MEIPHTVRLTPNIRYEVVWTDNQTNYGECRPDVKQIVLSRTLNKSKQQKIKTFVHELCHAISFEYKGKDLTEEQVMMLERGIYTILKLNRESLMQMIME